MKLLNFYMFEISLRTSLSKHNFLFNIGTILISTILDTNFESYNFISYCCSYQVFKNTSLFCFMMLSRLCLLELLSNQMNILHYSLSGTIKQWKKSDIVQVYLLTISPQYLNYRIRVHAVPPRDSRICEMKIIMSTSTFIQVFESGLIRPLLFEKNNGFSTKK